MKIVDVKRVPVALSGPDNPRNDTASVVELKDGTLLLTWTKFGASKEGGSDFGVSRIYMKQSKDGGLTWEKERMIVDVVEGDLNVQAPALCLLPSGELLLACVRVHGHNSTTMLLYRSSDNGESFYESTKVWERSNGQWIQGGATSIVPLSNGRLLLPFHGGVGNQEDQHNIVKCFISEDEGHTWHLSKGFVNLPMRGAMEASVAELDNGILVMSLRTQLGSVFLSRSYDGGETWNLAQTTGLKTGESCTCLRKIPNTNTLLLIWNDTDYLPNHHHYGNRTALSLAISADEGRTWSRIGNIEEGNYEFTDINCTFLSSKQAVITYMKAPGPKVQTEEELINGGLGFSRTGIDLWAAIVSLE